eukprot:219892-Chlamydomonas_euryale.AAC.1
MTAACGQPPTEPTFVCLALAGPPSFPALPHSASPRPTCPLLPFPALQREACSAVGLHHPRVDRAARRRGTARGGACGSAARRRHAARRRGKGSCGARRGA